MSYDGATLYSVRNTINKYVNHPNHSYYTTSSIYNDSTSQNNLKNNCKFDFNNDHSTVFLVNTSYLGHYNGKSSIHFISGYSYNDYGSFNIDTIGLADCNYNSTYGGTYTENFNNVFTALYSKGTPNFIW